jgi:Zn-finger nucleic acid-binding protein
MEDDVVGVAGVLSARPRHAPAARAAIRCPVCARELIATEISRVRVDFCTAHGTWLDHADVEAIADAVAIASSGSSSQKDWEARLTGDLGVLPQGLVTALGTVIAVGEHSRRVRRPRP